MLLLLLSTSIPSLASYPALLRQPAANAQLASQVARYASYSSFLRTARRLASRLLRLCFILLPLVAAPSPGTVHSASTYSHLHHNYDHDQCEEAQ